MNAFIAPLVIMVSISLILGLVLVIASRFLAEYGPCRISIKGNKDVEVIGGETLLSSLFENKIFIPSACGGRGSCGYCKLKVTSGGGSVLPTELPYLTPSEVVDDVRLACQLKVKSDMEIEVPEEYLSIQEYRAEVAQSISLTYDMKELRFRLLEPETINFKPGQYIQFHVPSTNREVVYRAYSIASLPSMAGELELIVRLVPGGIGSTYIHNLSVGDEVTISGSCGDFFLHERSSCDILLIGGGAGMAPLKSILYSLFEKGSDRKIDLFFGVRAKKDLFYLEEFERLAKEHPNFTYTYALSSPGEADDWKGEKGFIHLVLERHLKEGEKREAYLCGPPLMADAVIKVLKEKGVDPSNIYYDKF
ncbi:MAG: 2Fe-2S iron-sulfur cluster binding domain-containing protein [Proteobacteria bacterium]|nr:2Fe-2S iron-sulfur cluster binding domain-containing protein [Pseudomonadota bacterium]